MRDGIKAAVGVNLEFSDEWAKIFFDRRQLVASWVLPNALCDPKEE